MHRPHAIALLTLLAACGPVDDLEPRDTDALPEPQACGARPTEVLGSEGHVPMDPTSDVIVRFNRPVPEHDWSLTLEGATGFSELGADHTSVVFRPDEPLQAEATHALTATICGRAHSLTITTGRSRKTPAEGTEPWSLDLFRADWDRPQLARRWLEADLQTVFLTVHRDEPRAEIGTLLPEGMGWARCGAATPLAHHAATDTYRSEAGPLVLRVPDGPMVFERLAVEHPAPSRAVRIHGRLDTRRSAHAEGLCEELPRGCMPCEDGTPACAPFEGQIDAPLRLELDPGDLHDACE